MLIRKLTDCPEIVAGDKSLLREILHPSNTEGFNSRYSLAHAVVKGGERTVRHRMKTDEVYFILSGQARIHVGKEEQLVGHLDCIYIPGGTEQWIENVGKDPLCFLCIVDPAWNKMDEIILG